MTATYQLALHEFKPEFVDWIKQKFQAGKVTVTIEEEEDETTFLLKNPRNRQRLLKSIENVEAGRLVDVNIDEYLVRLEADAESNI
jgi:hypothetical protein